MAASQTRAKVLRLYKHLHRTVQATFKGDHRAQIVARDKICEEFEKSRHLSNPASVQQLIQHGEECAVVLRKRVIQAVARPQRDGKLVYRAKIRGTEQLVDNALFRDDVSKEEYKAARKLKKEGKSPCET